MRRCLAWCLVCFLVACDGPPPAASGANVMVLELGGEQPPLRETVLSARAQRSPPVGKPGEPRSEPSPEVVPPVFAAPRTVILSAGQTLYGIAREHLGSANRWPELLELNQWTAEDARRLPPGTVVKLPDN